MSTYFLFVGSNHSPREQVRVTPTIFRSAPLSAPPAEAPRVASSRLNPDTRSSLVHDTLPVEATTSPTTNSQGAAFNPLNTHASPSVLAHSPIGSAVDDHHEDVTGADDSLVDNEDIVGMTDAATCPVDNAEHTNHGVGVGVDVCDYPVDTVEHTASGADAASHGTDSGVCEYPMVTRSVESASPLLDVGVVQSTSSSNTHTMLTRSKRGIFKPKLYAVTTSLADVVPTSVRQALLVPEWKEAVHDKA
ncbi:hypothetical protein HRI_003820900 [Hibiscus trionum]|uniref:Uncharacterized protein n=1 Tax=Hibiscus trionum TaxID=183268 RepID=A0A9W7IUS7_HIBTR|nr:hypothetical protein HRI_003820900 [Hibiscus trionum]